MLVLGLVNIATLFFLDEPMGSWLAFLAMASMAPNIPIMLNVRGFAKVMAVPHVPPLLILVGIILFARPSGSDLAGHQSGVACVRYSRHYFVDQGEKSCLRQAMNRSSAQGV